MFHLIPGFEIDCSPLRCERIRNEVKNFSDVSSRKDETSRDSKSTVLLPIKRSQNGTHDEETAAARDTKDTSIEMIF